jgi:hypothetical protein
MLAAWHLSPLVRTGGLRSDMLRLLETSLLGAAVVATLGTAPLRAQDLTGCYRLRLGTWSGPLPAAESLESPPSVFALDSVPARRPLPFGMRVRPMNPAYTTPIGHEPRWWRTGPDSVHVVWSNGFDGVELELRAHGRSLRGTARAFAGANGRRRPRASAFATRVTCPPEPLHWTPVR